MPYINAFRIEEIDSGEYYAQLPIVRLLQEKGWFRFNSPVTFFVGENGSGKSTLLEALAVCAGMNAEGGSRNFTFATKRTESGLHRYISLARGARERDSFFLRAESFYNVATEIERLDETAAAMLADAPQFLISAPPVRDYFGGKSLHEQSHGESFLFMVQNRLSGGLYILDEPEAALSPTRQMTLLVEFQRLINAGAQLIIATHAPILLAFPGAEIYEITDEGIARMAYEDCDHVRVTKRFLNDPQGMVRRLME